jgi:hypothetical protein
VVFDFDDVVWFEPVAVALPDPVMVPDAELVSVFDPLPAAEVLPPVLLAVLPVLPVLPVPVVAVESVWGLVPSR